MKDAVIGVVKGYGWNELRNYAVSLAKCGFEGDKILFVDGISEEATKNLVRLGFILVPYENPSSIRDKKCGSQEDSMAWGFFGRWRFRPIIDWLQPRIDSYRYIVWCDVRDVMFQTDPATWLAENLNGAKLVGAAEGYQIKNQQHNAFWAQCTSPKDYEWLKEEEVCCSGTFAGEALTMFAVFVRMYSLHETIADPRAFDQGLWNLAARTSPFKEVFRIPKMREGFCATGWPSKNLCAGMQYATDQSPVYMDDMIVYAPETGVPFSIVHQYDREPAWANQISRLMAEVDAPVGPPIILIASCEAYRKNGFNDAVRETWLKKWGHLVEYRFVLGRECKDPGPDEIIIDAPDAYSGLTHKVHAMSRWATANGYGHRFHCGTDTYIHVPRLLASGFEKFDYVGFLMHDMHRLYVGRNVQFAQGGGGYWLSPRAAAVVEAATIPDWVKNAEDVFVGNALFEAQVPFTHDNGYWGRLNPEEPLPTADVENHAHWKSFHLSKWRGEPKYDAQWMRDAHAVWADRI